jgi:hypothetical protein
MTHEIDLQEKISKWQKEMRTTTAYFTYGRFSPSHRGHKIIIDRMLEAAKGNGAVVFVFVSPSGGRPEIDDMQKNPLLSVEKTELLRAQYSVERNKNKIKIINMSNFKGSPKSAFAALFLLREAGFTEMEMFRGKEIGVGLCKAMVKYVNGCGVTLTCNYEFRDPSTSMSATKLRKLALVSNEKGTDIEKKNAEDFIKEIKWNGVTTELALKIMHKIKDGSSAAKGGGKKRSKRKRRSCKRKRRSCKRKRRSCKRKRRSSKRKRRSSKRNSK